MKKCFPLLLICFLLTGCAGLLERSYSMVEPYSDRYWDSTAEDTLRAENRQDLVNSLLMLVEERVEEGVIRCYGEASSYQQARSACREVSEETAIGSYLLDELTFRYGSGAGYSSVTCYMTYREDADDPASLMTLSDSQSLVDLLRLAVREEHRKLTARFSYNTPREEVTAAIESLWQELREDQAAAMAPIDPASSVPDDEPEPEPEPLPPDDGEASGEEAFAPEALDAVPCPWEIRFYPDVAAPEIVEVLLTSEE